MRLTVGFLGWLCAALMVAGLPGLAPGSTNGTAVAAAHYHCAGNAQLAGNTNLGTLQEAFALPSADDVRDLALARISGALAGGLNLGSNGAAAPWLEPLLSDVMETESLGSFSGTATNSLSFVLALRLDSKRAQVWRENLGRAFGATDEKLTVEGFDGWRWKRGASDSFWIVPARDWLLVGRGDDLLPARADYLRQVSRQGRPGPALTDNWLEADLDCPRLAGWLPDCLQLLKPARIKLNVAGEKDNLRLTARMTYPEAIPWISSPWQMPTGLARGSIISFTAGQNVAAFLDLSPAFSRLDGDPLTSQFYAWALKDLPFLNYMAWPVADATNTLENLSIEASDSFNSELKRFNGTELLWLANQRKLVLSNLRVILPSLQVVQDQDREFLLLSVFPAPPTSEPAPDELWKQINGRTNLVYYDWELTGPRLQEWRILGDMLLRRWREPTEDLTQARRLEDRWLGELAQLTGNTVTEITRTAPNELSVVRRAPLGFTGIELFLLSDWLSTLGLPPVQSRPPGP
ncbi:MAG: hypothetical protein ABSA83_13900 [Verrucomicrobiota bacterium]|jgi:hypothetical protein